MAHFYNLICVKKCHAHPSKRPRKSCLSTNIWLNSNMCGHMWQPSPKNIAFNILTVGCFLKYSNITRCEERNEHSPPLCRYHHTSHSLGTIRKRHHALGGKGRIPKAWQTVLIGCVTGGGRGSKNPKNLRDVIYRWSLTHWYDPEHIRDDLFLQTNHDKNLSSAIIVHVMHQTMVQ